MKNGVPQFAEARALADAVNHEQPPLLALIAHTLAEILETLMRIEKLAQFNPTGDYVTRELAVTTKPKYAVTAKAKKGR